MKKCPYCNYSNYDYATVCRKCESSFTAAGGTVYHGQTRRIAPDRAKAIRSQALSLIVLGLLIKVYWGGYGPWPTIDFPNLVTIRTYAEPLLLYGGAALYISGLIGGYL
jgi:hypothetical protein